MLLMSYESHNLQLELYPVLIMINNKLTALSFTLIQSSVEY